MAASHRLLQTDQRFLHPLARPCLAANELSTIVTGRRSLDADAFNSPLRQSMGRPHIGGECGSGSAPLVFPQT
jgi:hypothetical protein